MKFIADLHVHSKYSRATAKNLDFENLYIAAQLKGLTVIATGDFTHPAWFAEIKEKMIEAEPGLFKLKEDIKRACDVKVPLTCRREIRFVLVSEISNIYKKNNKTRKNHNLIFMPDLKTAEKFNKRLDNIGNIKSDGRPILGLDARDLLEIALETTSDSCLIPAHIWTPWFSLFGSKSGFNSIKECFDDLSHHIFAVETGLSSDPSMNWRVSELDGLSLISNSDAHSPLKLGREANLFDTELSFYAIKEALKNPANHKFKGTLEFFPEEGKYYADGHRKCNINFLPPETKKHNGICPVCGKPLTLGVLYRVDELADRPDGEKPENAKPYYKLIPLEEILSKLLKVGPKSKKVQTKYMSILEKLGSELDILRSLDKDVLDKVDVPLFGEAVINIRNNKIKLFPGYDGEYGTITLFSPDEMEKNLKQRFFQVPKEIIKIKKKKPVFEIKKKIYSTEKASIKSIEEKKIIQKINLNKEQSQAVEYKNGSLLIVAGPGTGKTMTITQRIIFLIKERNISPNHILAVTFTRQAAKEMQNRLTFDLKTNSKPLVTTFHALCYKILTEQAEKKDNRQNTIIDDNERKLLLKDSIILVENKGFKINIKKERLLKWIISAKQRIIAPNENLSSIAKQQHLQLFKKVYECYQTILTTQGLCDYEDLIFQVITLFKKKPDIKKEYSKRFQYIFIDEYQDINYGQYRLIQDLSTNNNICAIGDPDQSIYGFRGSDNSCFSNFLEDYPDTCLIRLKRNYRSTETILKSSFQIIKKHQIKLADISQTRVYSQINGYQIITIMESAGEASEAVAIGKIIEKMIGGTGFQAIDFAKVDGNSNQKEYSFADFAVLYRTRRQGEILKKFFETGGIPLQLSAKKSYLKIKGIIELIALVKILEKRGSIFDFEKIVNILSSRISKKMTGLLKKRIYQKKLSLEETFEMLKRLPIPDMKKADQKKLYNLIEKIDFLREQISGLTVEEKLSFLVKNTGLSLLFNNDSEIMDVYEKLLLWAKKYGSNIKLFLSEIALWTDQDFYDKKAEKVSLMTIHAAKGLEFPVVFIAGCEDKYIPLHTSKNIDEERRLFYVAMTRAKERLFLSMATQREIFGLPEARCISPFVKNIENELKEQVRPDKPKVLKKKQIQLELF